MSLATTLQGIAFTARISLPTVVDAALGRTSMQACDERLEWWSRSLVEAARIDLVVEGREHAEGSEPFVVMSNHQSHYDIPVLFRAIPGRLRMVAKKELFSIPVFGPAMLASGFVRIDRQDHDKAVATLETSARMLDDGVRLWIAPEGTRSRTGELARFKSGGFRLALQAGARILPVTIDGTRRVLPRGARAVRLGQRVTITIHPPVDPRAYGLERRKELVAEIERVIGSRLSPPG